MVEGVIEAPSESVAIEKINELGYVPIMVTGTSKSHEEPRAGITASRGGHHPQVVLFSRHLARLIKSGVPLLKAIQVLAEQSRESAFRNILESIESEIRKGKTLSQAMSAYPETFSTTYVAIVRAGEVSGGLEEALSRMAAHLKKQKDLRSKVLRALAYPVFLGGAGILSIFFIITFIVPRLSKMFLDIGQALPLPTRLIIAMGGWMQRYWLLFLLVAALVIFAVPKFIKKYLGEDFFDEWKLKLPLVGEFVLKTEFARFSRTLELSLTNGLSFLEALGTAIPVVENAVLRKALENCYLKIEKGDSFGRTLGQEARFPRFTANLIAIGEESGNLNGVLAEIAEAYEEDTDEILMYLTTLLEPVMILTVGAIVGFIVIAMLLPIFEMNAVF